MDKITDNMREYVCDTLCKFRDDNSLTQEELDAICEGCRLEAYTGDIPGSSQSEAVWVRDTGVSAAAGIEAGLKDVDRFASWKNRMMNRFMRAD